MTLLIAYMSTSDLARSMATDSTETDVVLVLYRHRHRYRHRYHRYRYRCRYGCHAHDTAGRGGSWTRGLFYL